MTKRKPKSKAIAPGVALALAAFTAATAIAETFTATATPIAVDVYGGPIRTISPRDVGYSPRWGGVTDAGAHVVIYKVEHADTANAVTSVVATCSADAEGVEALTIADNGERCLRLIHCVYDSSDAEVGTPLIRDVSFGYASEVLPSIFADTRENSLQEAVNARAQSPVMLTYDTSWATNGVPDGVTISAVLLTGEGGTAVATDSLLSAASPATGQTHMNVGFSGWMRLVCRIAGGGDATLLEYVTGDFLLKDFATIILMR